MFFLVQIHDQSEGLHPHYDPDGVHYLLRGRSDSIGLC